MPFEINVENIENNKNSNKLFFRFFGSMFPIQFMLGQINRVEFVFASSSVKNRPPKKRI